MNDEVASNTGTNTPLNKGYFKKSDPRINRKGRPKSFDALRDLAQQIAHETAMRDGQPIIISGHKVTIAEAILREWARSGKPQLQQGFIEIAFGKVPTPIEIRDWREAAKREGLNPDEVINDFVKVISEHMAGDGDSGSDRESIATETHGAEVDTALPPTAS